MDSYSDALALSPPTISQQYQRQQKQQRYNKTMNGSLIIAIIILSWAHGLSACPKQQERCSLPQKYSSIVKFIDCDIDNVTDITSRVSNAIALRFDGNNITKIDPDAFKELYRLRNLAITRNHHLTLSPKSIFIRSTTVVFLDISENSDIPCLYPSVFEGTPNLKKVRMRMNENCRCTRQLMQEANKTIIFECDPSDTINRRGEDNKGPDEISTSMSIPSRDPALQNSTTESSDHPYSGVSNSITLEFEESLVYSLLVVYVAVVINIIIITFASPWGMQVYEKITDNLLTPILSYTQSKAAQSKLLSQMLNLVKLVICAVKNIFNGNYFVMRRRIQSS